MKRVQRNRLRKRKNLRRALATVYLRAAFIHDELEDYVTAVECSQEAIKLLKQLHDKKGIELANVNLTWSYAGLAENYHTKKNWIKAVYCYQKSIALAKKFDAWYSVVMFSRNLAAIMLEMGNRRRAKPLAQQSLAADRTRVSR